MDPDAVLAALERGEVRRTTSGALLAFDGDVVVKVHPTGTDPDALAARLAAAAALPQLLGPLAPEPLAAGSRWATAWPRVLTVGPDPDAAPWAEAGRLLAALHLRPVPDGLPGHNGARRLHARSGDPVVAAAAKRLPLESRLASRPGRPVTVVHGDWHLGQLGRRAPEQPWLLLDVDDLGSGDPVWDLARPAGLWAAGLLPDREWTTFLEAYREAGGPALPADPAGVWPVLDPVARAAVVHTAAAALRRAEAEGRAPDELDERLLDTCRELSGDPPMEPPMS